ncbi:mastermind-like protein 1 isoform X1 [Danio rerio]|uniref:Mastermind-like protein 1 isoform X1 n=1 Tax=Danio rerio TaxID=7955 RepID=A0A0R4IKI2_DANRE|nr:mastermind-like protein 1 isoform X1 [Danio rerio]|eukprot:XP_005157273.2 mastermind-like protein 1 isoform X1 [Danio rerio]
MMADFVVPRHSAVMERLRRRIELFRRHHTGCENRYDNTAMERLEMERQQTIALQQRFLQTKAKRSNKHRQPPAAAAASADPVGQRGASGGGGSAEIADGGSGTPGEQSRNSTLIALQETVKRKLESAESPLGRDQVNGFTDGYPPNKKSCVEDAMGGLNGVSNGVVPPLSPLDTKHNVNTDAMMANGNHRVVGSEHNGASLKDNGAVRGSESDFRLKEPKQEPVDDALSCILPQGGANGNNSLFPDLNLNDQDWSEIMEEFNRSVPYEDIQELFSVSFGDRKDPELTSAAAQSLISQDLPNVKTEISPATATSAFEQDSCNGSPQMRPTSSGPPLHTNSPVTAPATSPALPVPQHSQQGSIQSRALPNHLMPVPPKDLSPAQQLQQLAQQRAILHSQQHVVQKPPQQKPPQQQPTKFHQQPSHSTSWPQNAPTQSQMGGTFGLEKPTSPSLYPQDFPNPKTLLMPNKGSPKAGAPAGYMQPGGHANMLSHPAAPTGPLGHPSNPGAQAAMLDFNNTKPLSHYDDGPPGAPRGPPTTQNHNKPNQAILNMMRQQQIQKQRAPTMNFRPAHLPHTAQDSGSYPPNTHVPGPSNTMTPQTSSNSIPGHHNNPAYLKQQQIQLMNQQKQFQLQRQIMVEQEKQRQQQEQQLQRHLTRPPPQYQDQQNPQAQQNPFQQQQQQVSQFTSVPPCLAQQHTSNFSEHTISGASQPIGNVNTLSGPAPGTQRMFSQTQGMMGIGVGQNAGPNTGPSTAASQADMSLPPCSNLDVQQVLYGNISMHASHANQQRQPVSTMSAAYRQNVLAAQQQAHLKNQPNAALLKQQQQQLARLPNNMANAMSNNMGSAMPTSMPTSIPGALPVQAQSWQQQPPQQHPALQSGSANGAMPAGFPNSSFHMQSRLTKLPNNTPFPQGGMGNSAAGRTMGGMNPGQMMTNMNQQRTNNPGMPQQLPPPVQQTAQQGQPQAPPQTQQVLPDLGPFSQAQAVPNRTTGLQCNQAYQLNRAANQQLQFSYNTQSGGSLSGFPAETDLVDSLLKDQSTQQWMDDIDELLASHQ